MQKIIKSKIQMTNKGQIIYSLLPRAEGLLLGTICGMEVENFNREGAVKTLTNTIALLHKVRLLLEQELNSEPQLPQADAMQAKPDAEHIEQVFAKAGHNIQILGRLK